ncbi:MAG: hypothetical protein GTO22_20910 [Gemmatimonadales bacterium]|nr:hypothetical protein [Gemmatimonadales bacterium]
MSQHDLPLWARGLAAVLLLISSWWLLHTETLRSVVGDSIALLSLGVIAVFILRGMHLPLGIWPVGPWRKEFSVSVVVAVALVFAVFIVLASPSESADLRGRLDVGTFLLVMAGVVAWGFSWAFVKQREYLPWYGIAAAAALLPCAVALMGLQFRAGGSTELCVLSTQQGPAGMLCDTTVLRSFVLLVPLGVAAGLVTVELTFRRMLLGLPDRTGLLLILCGAVVSAAWVGLVAADIPGVGYSWWLAGLGAVGAGCLYALSGSLLVSALYSALVFSFSDAVLYGSATMEEAANPPASLGIEFALAHLAVAGMLAALVFKRKGLLRGIR